MSNLVNLETFAGGALAEQINSELEKVIENIYDPNTDQKKARKLTLTITFKPYNKRNGASVSIQAKSTLSPVIPTETNIMIDKDIKTGKVLASELGNQIAGQTEMNIEVEEKIPDGSDGVIDLRKKANNE